MRCLFCRRFWMYRQVFLHIVQKVSTNDNILSKGEMTQEDLVHHSCKNVSLQCGCMLTYNNTKTNHVDEHLKLCASTTTECLAHFVDKVISQFLGEYLIKATPKDVHRLLRIGTSWLSKHDREHWLHAPIVKKLSLCFIERNVSRKSQNNNYIGSCWFKWSLDLTCIFWHIWLLQWYECVATFSCFYDVLHGRASQMSYNVNRGTYNIGYYLTYGIHPKWHHSFSP